MTQDAPDQAAAMQNVMDEKKEKTALLASKYTKTKRTIEISCVCISTALLCVSLIRICNVFFFQNIWAFLCACVLSMYMVDFFSGIVHCKYITNPRSSHFFFLNLVPHLFCL